MKKQYQIAFVCILFIVALLLTSCIADILPPSDNIEEPDSTNQPTDETDHTSPTPEPPPSTPEPKGSTTIHLRAAGDIMMHMPQVNAGLQADGGYDFTHFFEDIRPYLEGADIVTGNLETTISNPEKGYGGYPMFRTPESLLPALKEAGFNVLTTANNHTFDGREFGVGYTLDKLDEYGLLYTGSARSQQERDRVLIVERNEIKAAILAYTYGTNGMEVTISNENLPFMVNYIDRDKIRQDVNRAKEAGADVLIVSIHWGDEYVREPNAFQKEMADFLVSLGVDIILGSHSHVIQPMEKRTVTLDDGTEKNVFVIYSLGNFISNQRDRYRDSGVIVDLEIIKNHDKNTITLGEISYTPTWVYRYSRTGGSNYRILPVGQFMEEDGGLGSSDRERIRSVWEETTTHLGVEVFQPNR